MEKNKNDAKTEAEEKHPSKLDMRCICKRCEGLPLNGIWRLSWGTYKRTGKREMTLIDDRGDIQAGGLTEAERKNLRERTKKTIEAIRWKYKEEKRKRND